MDFSNRNVQAQATAPGTQSSAPSSSFNNKKRKADKSEWTRVIYMILLGGIAVLLIGLIALIAFGGDKKEDTYVDSNRLQAVFLNTGQVYFGNIKTLNSKYFVVSNIYYLQTSNSGSTTDSSSAAKSNVTLVKLGCELHEPYDQMVINSDQVTFWENLQDNGQVAKAVATFEKDNPNGQKCADQSTSSSSTSNNVQSANGSGSSTPAPATTPAATKP